MTDNIQNWTPQKVCGALIALYNGEHLINRSDPYSVPVDQVLTALADNCFENSYKAELFTMCGSTEQLFGPDAIVYLTAETT